MREPEQMGWFAELDSDGEPVAVHGVMRLMPEGSVAITEAQAREISAVRRANEPPRLFGEAPQPGATFHVDLQPILDRLDAQAQVLAAHATVLDEQAAALSATAAKFDEHAKAIVDVKRTTAQAIAQSLEGLGGEGA